MPTACNGRSRVGWRGVGCDCCLESRTHRPCSRVGCLTRSDMSQLRPSYPSQLAAGLDQLRLAAAPDDGLAYDGCGQKPKSLHLSGVSVAPSGADIRRLAQHGRKVPTTDNRHQLPSQPRPPWNCVMLGAGGLGYFLTVSKYSSTCLSAGSDTQPNIPPTMRSSCGSISML
jgi:hypothetical protein